MLIFFKTREMDKMDINRQRQEKLNKLSIVEEVYFLRRTEPHIKIKTREDKGDIITKVSPSHPLILTSGSSEATRVTTRPG